MKTRTIFRTFRGRHAGDVIALFPELPHDRRGDFCVSYQHIGQHGAADPGIVRSATRPATPAETAPLAAELARIGYEVEPVKRFTPAMHRTRRENAGAV